MARKTIHSTGGFWLILGALLLAASLRLLFWAAVAAGREPVKNREPSEPFLGTDDSRFRLAGSPGQTDLVSVFSP